MSQTVNDRDLVHRIAGQDRAAFQALYARHQTRAFRFILRLIRNEAVAEELVNDVFLDVWRQAGRFEGGSAVSTWILAIARNKTYSVLRKRCELQMPDGAAEALEDETDTPEITTQKSDKSQMMRTCMEGLSAQHREVIDLVYYHEKSIREVAQIVGIPQNTVKTRMFHARKKMGEALKQAGLDRGWP